MQQVRQHAQRKVSFRARCSPLLAWCGSLTSSVWVESTVMGARPLRARLLLRSAAARGGGLFVPAATPASTCTSQPCAHLAHFCTARATNSFKAPTCTAARLAGCHGLVRRLDHLNHDLQGYFSS